MVDNHHRDCKHQNRAQTQQQQAEDKKIEKRQKKGKKRPISKSIEHVSMINIITPIKPSTTSPITSPKLVAATNTYDNDNDENEVIRSQILTKQKVSHNWSVNNLIS